MSRSSCVFAAFLFLAASVVSAAPVIDGRLAYLETKAAGRDATFSGSIRFIDKPDATDFAALAGLGLTFFDYGAGPVGSRTVYPARIPFAAVEKLERMDRLVAVECAWRSKTPPPLVLSRPEVEVDEVWQHLSPAGGTLSGKGVTVCDIDTGINYMHPNFFFLSGEVFAWLDLDLDGVLSSGDAVDLNDNGFADSGENLMWMEMYGVEHYGNDPIGFDTDFDFLYNDANGNAVRDSGPPSFNDGDPCYGEQLFIVDDDDGDGILDPSENLLALGSSKVRAIWNKNGTVYRRGVNLLASELDSWGHGTQVSGIFGGGWVGPRAMSGMAPGAESLHVNYDFQDEPPFLIPIEAGLAWAVAEGADIVLIEDGEWVWEFLDGSSNVEIMINEYAADDGVIFVVPAGNLATGHMHASFSSATGAVISVDEAHSIIWPSFLWTDGASLSLSVTPPGGTPVALPADGSSLIAQDYLIYSQLSTSSRGTNRFDVRMAPYSGSTLGGDWTFTFTGPDTDMHGYFGDDYFSWVSASNWNAGQDATSTVTWPATADSAITVSAYNISGAGDIDNYSGWGPRVDGRPIMDIAAPGRTVYSAGPFGGYSPFSGTSGAGPHVAGAAALLKELVPDLDNASCRRYLRAGAGTDAFTGDSSRWGAGKLRIGAAVAELLVAVEQAPAFPDIRISAFPNPFNPRTTLRFRLPESGAARLRVFDLAGREVWHRNLSPAAAGMREVIWQGRDVDGRALASGIYFVHVRQGETYSVGKVSLVR